jgi:ribonucleoside-triphosphate reductase
MVKQILKRDGRIVSFDGTKIENAIIKAMNAVGDREIKVAKKLAGEAEKLIDAEFVDKTPTVEEIQDIVEKVLMKKGHDDVAKAYILYRAKRNRVRVMNTDLMKTIDKISNTDAKDSDLKRENANIDGDTAMGVMLKYGAESAKNYNVNAIIDPKQANAYLNGDIHIHDFDFYTLTETCCQIDIEKLFKGGFHTGHGSVREPQDIRTYASLVCIAIQANQNDQHGGQSVPNFDYGCAPGVMKTYKKLYRSNFAKAYSIMIGKKKEEEIIKLLKKIEEKENLYPTLSNSKAYNKAEEKLMSELKVNDSDYKKIKKFASEHALEETDKATHQAMEAIIHNLNTMHSRAGAQVPFSSINFGTDTTPEGRMVIKNILLATEEGLGNGETAIFPISIFKVKEGVNYNPGEPNYDLFKRAIEVSSKRMFPNFSFIDAPFNLQYYKKGHPETEVAYMGCRTRVMGNVYDPSREITNGRGNLSFTSINLPRLAIEAKGDIKKFYASLDEKLELVTQQLLDRFEIQKSKHVYNYPFLMGQGIWIDSDKLGPTDSVAEVLKHGSLTYGFIGLAETLVALTGKHHGQNQKSWNLGYEIIKHMRDFADKKSAEYKLNFTVIATPAEGLSGRFVRMDKKKYGLIKGVTDRDYYTNSFHVPVYYNISAEKKIDLEAPFHNLCNGGHISYIELDGDTSNNLEAFEKVVRHMKEAGIGYGAINHPIDRDPVCGYNGIIGDTCPHCGRRETDGKLGFERIRRITGYLVGTLDRFNNAKRAEEHDRVKHN